MTAHEFGGHALTRRWLLLLAVAASDFAVGPSSLANLQLSHCEDHIANQTAALGDTAM